MLKRVIVAYPARSLLFNAESAGACLLCSRNDGVFARIHDSRRHFAASTDSNDDGPVRGDVARTSDEMHISGQSGLPFLDRIEGNAPAAQALAARALEQVEELDGSGLANLLGVLALAGPQPPQPDDAEHILPDTPGGDTEGIVRSEDAAAPDLQLALFKIAFHGPSALVRKTHFSAADQALLAQVGISLVMEGGDQHHPQSGWADSRIKVPPDVMRACTQALQQREAVEAIMEPNIRLATAAQRAAISHKSQLRVAKVPYTLALAIPAAWTAVEIDGSWAVAPDCSLSLAARLRRRHLALAGWHVHAINDKEWNDLSQEPGTSGIEEYLIELEGRLGTRLPFWSTGD